MFVNRRRKGWEERLMSDCFRDFIYCLGIICASSSIKGKKWFFITSSRSGKSFKMSRVEEKLRSCFEYGNYYEAHQIYRTVYNRLSNQGKWQELQDVLYGGIMRLIEG